MRIVRPLVVVALLFVFVIAFYTFLIWPVLFQVDAKVIHMIDPDSYIVMQDGKLMNVQLIGVDAPETKLINGEKFNECYSEEAKKSVLQTLFNKDRGITLESDTSAGEKDIHGRLLKYMYLKDGTFVNGTLLDEGLARVYNDGTNKFSKSDDFLELQKNAKNEKRGLWEFCI